jgi:two-component system LytT family sensor kinase
MNRNQARQWLQLSVIWIIVALVPIGRIYLFDPFPYQAWFYIILLILGLILIPLLIVWIGFLQRKRFNWIKIVLIQLFLSVFVALLFHYTTDEYSTTPKKRTSPSEFQQMPTVKKVTFHLFSGSSYAIFTSLMMLSGLALLIEYNEQLQQRKNKENELKVNLVMSQIKALQSELQPHFLFNTLHAASSIMEVDVKKAQRLLEKLSFLLRNYLDIINRHYYSLEEEIAFLKEYIQVQELRHSGAIELKIEIPENCLKLDIPVILLQPIIENSIKHGWVDRNEPLFINIKAECSIDSISISVLDNGMQVKAAHSSGIGIRNLKERLDVLYGATYSFTEKTNGGHQTQIILPVRS